MLGDTNRVPPNTFAGETRVVVAGEACPVLLGSDLLFSCAHFVGRICFGFAIQQPPADLASVEAGFDTYRRRSRKERPRGSFSTDRHSDEAESIRGIRGQFRSRCSDD